MAKIITYDVPTNTISADGGTAADPITPQDIQDAIDAGGWGVEYHYAITDDDFASCEFWIFHCEIEVGFDSETYWKQDKQGIMATGGLSFGSYCTHTINRSVVIGKTSGYLYGTADWDWSWVWLGDWYRFNGTVDNCTMMAYSSGIYGPQMRLRGAADYSHCQFYRLLTVFRDSEDTFDDLVANRVKAGEITVYFNDAHILLESAITYDGQLHVVNPDPPLSTLTLLKDGDSIYEEYRLQPLVCDVSGNPITGVTVTAVDTNGIEQAQYETQADGLPADETLIPRTTATRADGETTEVNHNPYTITFEKEGYQTVTVVGDIEDDLEDPIVLLAWPEAPTEAEVKAGVEFFDGNIGTYIGSSYSLEAVCELPTVEIEVTAPAVTVEVSNA